MNQQNLIVLHLSLLTNINPVVVHAILQSPELLPDLYAASASMLMRTYGIPQEVADKLVAGLANKTILEAECTLIKQHNIKVMTLLDDDYPYLLKQIHLPPPVLYWQGTPLSDAQKHIAIVGSRKANSYGQQIIDAMVPTLVERGWVIVSGGAIGADSMAHQVTVNANGRTVVVLGSGLLRPHPSRNKKLFNDVVTAGGTVLSPFPLMMEGFPSNFPARNRIISGLSRGCVVVQAAQESGASITAHLALNQGRDVFAVPGPVHDELSAGCHMLIQEGAKLITGVNDILIEYGEYTPVKVDKRQSQKAVVPPPQQMTVAMDMTPRGIIIRECAQLCSVDDLLAATGLPLGELQSKLFDLQLEGVITQNFAGKWHSAAR